MNIIKNIKLSWHNIFLNRKASKAKRLADSLHNLDGRTYYVVLIQGVFKVLNNRDVRAYNKKANRIKVKQLSYSKMRESAIYIAG